MTTQLHKSENPPEKQFDDHSVIVPPHKLKKAVTHLRGPAQIDMSAIDRAEAALAELKSEFSGWMNSECERLDAARRIVREQGMNRGTADALFMPAHDIKGGAATLGFPLAERLATSLCRLLKHAPQPGKIPMKLVDHHVDAVRALVRENISDALNPYGLEISNRLSILVETFLSEELQDAYAEIAGDAAPRMEIPGKV